MKIKYKMMKWIGLAIIVMTICNIFIYDIYSRNEFIRTQIMELIYGFALLGIYYYINREDKQ